MRSDDTDKSQLSSVERIKMNISKIANISNEDVLPNVKISLAKSQKKHNTSQGRVKLNIDLSTQK